MLILVDLWVVFDRHAVGVVFLFPFAVAHQVHNGIPYGIKISFSDLKTKNVSIITYEACRYKGH